MKIKEIYTANNNFGNLTLVKNNSFERVEIFFSKLDPIYSQNYYKNKETLQLFLLDKMNFDQVDASYTPDGNFIFISHVEDDLTHELMHMASVEINGNERKDFSTNGFWSDELVAIEEGMAEFLASLIDKKPFLAYVVESFVAKMLCTSTDKGILLPFFKADGQGFIDMFNKKDIYNVLINLSVFHYNQVFGAEVFPDEDKEGYEKCFYDMLEALIDIELNEGRSSKKTMKYRDVFLSTLEEECMADEIDKISKDYHNKTKRLIDDKIRRRG